MEMVAIRKRSLGTSMTKAADQKHCFSCGSIIHISSPTCPNCGAAQPKVAYAIQAVARGDVQQADETGLERHPSELPPNHIFCRGCGQHIHETARSCPKCGAIQRANDSGYSQDGGGRSKVAAALFAFLLGGFGAHKFYLGSIGLGFLYLVFFWTFIPAIVALIEGILYLTMSDQEFDRKYN